MHVSNFNTAADDFGQTHWAEALVLLAMVAGGGWLVGAGLIRMAGF